MIKKRSGIDTNAAMKQACQNNGIILTVKGSNSGAVAYKDLWGRKKVLSDGFREKNMMRIFEAAKDKKVTVKLKKYNCKDRVEKIKCR